MITPRWVNTEAHPIAIENVIEYLVAAIKLPLQGDLYLGDRRQRRHFLRRNHARIRTPTQTIGAGLYASLVCRRSRYIAIDAITMHP